MKALIATLEILFSTPSGSAREVYTPMPAGTEAVVPAPNPIEQGTYARATSLSKVRVVVVGAYCNQ